MRRHGEARRRHAWRSSTARTHACMRILGEVVLVDVAVQPVVDDRGAARVRRGAARVRVLHDAALERRLDRLLRRRKHVAVPAPDAAERKKRRPRGCTHDTSRRMRRHPKASEGTRGAHLRDPRRLSELDVVVARRDVLRDRAVDPPVALRVRAHLLAVVQPAGRDRAQVVDVEDVVPAGRLGERHLRLVGDLFTSRGGVRNA